LGPKDAANFLAIRSTIHDHFNPLKSVEEGVDRAVKEGLKKGDKRNIEVVESDDDDDERVTKKQKTMRALPPPHPLFAAAAAASPGPRRLNIFNDSCKDINEYSAPLHWGVEEKASRASFFPGQPAIWVQMTEDAPEEPLLLIGIHMLTLPQAIYADFKFGIQRAVVAVRYVRPSHKADDDTKGSAQNILDQMQTVKGRADATLRTGYTAVMLLPAAAFKCSADLVPLARSSTDPPDVIGTLVNMCADEVPRKQAVAALRCNGQMQAFCVTKDDYLEPSEAAYPYMDDQGIDIALYNKFVHAKVIPPEDERVGETYDHVLDNFPNYLRTEGIAVHRRRWGKGGRGMLFRNGEYDQEEHAHHGEVAVGMSNFFCAFGTGEGIQNMKAMNAFIRAVDQIAAPFKIACMRISKGMRLTGELLHREFIVLHYDVPKNVKTFLPFVTATAPDSIEHAEKDKDDVRMGTEESIGSSSVSLEEEPIVPSIDDVIGEHGGVRYHRIARWQQLPADIRESMGEDDSDFEGIISSDDASVNSDMEKIGIKCKSAWRTLCNERGRQYEVLKKKRRGVWEARRLKHVARFAEKKKKLIPLYDATFLKPKDLEKQDLSDDDTWSPTSDFEVNYWERLMQKNKRMRERVADDAAANAATLLVAEAGSEAPEGGTPPATDSRGSVAATVIAE
jgi:hypothetical protein